jgi:hypothetical protein
MEYSQLNPARADHERADPPIRRNYSEATARAVTRRKFRPRHMASPRASPCWRSFWPRRSRATSTTPSFRSMVDCGVTRSKRRALTDSARAPSARIRRGGRFLLCRRRRWSRFLGAIRARLGAATLERYMAIVHPLLVGRFVGEAFLQCPRVLRHGQRPGSSQHEHRGGQSLHAQSALRKVRLIRHCPVSGSFPSASGATPW